MEGQRESIELAVQGLRESHCERCGLGYATEGEPCADCMEARDVLAVLDLTLLHDDRCPVWYARTRDELPSRCDCGAPVPFAGMSRWC